MSPRYRFAPSPTGMFHVGSARTVLFNWILATQERGRMVLRIEDTDEARNQPEWTQGILDAMAWLGIDAADPTFEGPYFQSDNVEHHVAFALRLAESGAAYYCDCSRDDVVARTATEHAGYDRFCRDRGLTAAPGRALRFRVPAGATVVRDLIRGEVPFDNDAIEDFVVLRGNGTPLFLIANVVDDVVQAITHVVRGEEHFPNTPKQQMLWEALGATPPVWAHVPVLVNAERKKLSKRRDKVALEQFRDEGYVMPAIRNYLMTLGWSPGDDLEIRPWDEIVSRFRLEDVVPSPAFFDLKKLAAFNGEYLRMMSPLELTAATQPWVEQWAEAHPQALVEPTTVAAMMPHLQPRLVTLGDVAGLVDFMFLPAPEFDDKVVDLLADPSTHHFLLAAIELYESCPWDVDSLRERLRELGAEHGLGLGKAQAPVRAAVTGRSVGPPLFEALELMGRDEVLARMRWFAERRNAVA